MRPQAFPPRIVFLVRLLHQKTGWPTAPLGWRVGDRQNAGDENALYVFPLRCLYFQPAMANILYGVNGEGAGHSTRSREVILHLQRQGHTVVAASFDRGLRNLADVCEVLEIHGLRFTYVNNQVRYNRTLARNLFQARKATRSISELTRFIAERAIELVITDYEPLTCRAGQRRKLPVISIDNQHILTHFTVATPRHYPMWTLRPSSSMLAVPEIRRMVRPFRSIRMPRENELGLA